jgi:hypothetical protein
MEKLKLNIQLFGASASISCTQVGSPDIANNTTTERITFTVTRTSGTTFWEMQKTVNFTVDGNSYTSSLSLPSNKTSNSCYVDVVIPHNADGTKTLSYSGSIVTGTSAGTLTASGTKVLTAIQIATNCPAIAGTVGSSTTVVISPKSSSYTHKLYWQNPYTSAWTDWATFSANETSKSITLANILGSFAGNFQQDGSRTGQIPIKLETYSSTTLVGTSPDTLSITVASEDALPKINSITFYDNNEDTYALTNDRTKLVNFMSEIQATVNFTLSKGASFRNITVSIPTDSGETFYPQVSRSGNVITFSVPDLSVDNNWSKLYNFNIIVQDTFGSATYTYDTSSNYVPYSPIYIVSPDLKIALSRPNLLSDKVFLGFAYEYWHGYYATNVQNNATIKWRVREFGGTWSNWQTLVENTDYKSIDRGIIEDYWTDRTIVGTFEQDQQDPETYNFTSIEIFNPLDTVWSYLKNYEFEIEMSDNLNTLTQSSILHSTISIYDAFQTSNGERYFNVNGHLIFNNEPTQDVLKLLPTTLFYNASGELATSTPIQLSESAGNFDYVEIFFRENDDVYNSVKVYNPNDKRVALISEWTNSSTYVYYKTKTVKFSQDGTTLGVENSNYYAQIRFGGSSGINISSDDTIYIERIVGYGRNNGL